MTTFRFILFVFIGSVFLYTLAIQRPSVRGQNADISKTVRRDRDGNPLPPHAVARLGTARMRHVGNIYTLAFSPEGKILATAGEDRLIRLWETSTGNEIRRLDGHRNEIFRLAFSPDGKKLVSAGGRDGTVRLWDVALGKEIRQWKHAGEHFYYVAISPDGRIVAAPDRKGLIFLWDAKTGEELRRVKGDFHGAFSTIAFAPDAKSIFVSCRGEIPIRQIDVATGNELRRLKGGGVRIALSPNGKMLVSQPGQFARMRMQDVATGKVICELRGHGFALSDVAFSADGKLVASAGDDGFARVHDVRTGKLIRQFRGYPDFVMRAMAFSRDGKLVAAVTHGMPVRIWNVKNGKELPLPDGHARGIVALAFSPDGKIVAAASDREKTISLWAARSGKKVGELKGHADQIRSLAFSPDGKTLASGSYINESEIRLWDVARRQQIGRLAPVHGPVEGLAFLPDGKHLASTGFYGQRARLWNVNTKKCIWSNKLNAAGMRMAVSSDGGLFATFDTDRNVQIRDAVTGKLRMVLPQRIDSLETLAFSRDGKMLATGALFTKYNNKNGRRYGVTDKTIRFWETATGKERFQLKGDQRGTFALAVSPDGNYVISGGYDHAAQFWNLRTGESQRLPGHQGAIHHVAYSPDGRWAATGSKDTTILVWNVAKLRIKTVAKTGRLTTKQLDYLWDELADSDAKRAFRAIRKMIAAPADTVPFLAKHLTKALPDAAMMKRLARAIKHLDSDRFRLREKAFLDLDRFGPIAAPALREVMKNPPSLEARLRAEKVLAKIGERKISPQQLRQLRALEVLEAIGSPAARKALARLTQGDVTIPLSREANASLRRLEKQ